MDDETRPMTPAAAPWPKFPALPDPPVPLPPPHVSSVSSSCDPSLDYSDQWPQSCQQGVGGAWDWGWHSQVQSGKPSGPLFLPLSQALVLTSAHVSQFQQQNQQLGGKYRFGTLH